MKTKTKNTAIISSLYTLPGLMSKKYLDMSKKYEVQGTSYQAPVVWESAKEVIVKDVDGNKYIDWTSGVLVTNIGHSHPEHIKAVEIAASKLMNCYDFPTPSRVILAKRMVVITPSNLDKVFFLSTGSETTEAAIRLAKRHTDNFEIISFYGGFHGRTYAAMSVSGLAGIKRRYGPLMPGVIRVPFPYCYRCPLRKRVEKCDMECFDLMDDIVHFSSTGSLAALIIEPYQGAAGFIFPPHGYLKRLENWARRKNILFILDEVQSSFGRTGKMFALGWENLKPNFLCIGKGIGSGIPISALLCESKVVKKLGRGELSSTTGGNPVSCSAAIAVLDIMEKEKIIANVNRIGKIMKSGLEKIMKRSKYLGDVRGCGLVYGLEFVKDKKTKEPAPEITKKVINNAAKRGLLVGSVGIYGNVIRVAPPLVINEKEAYQSLEIMKEVSLGL